MAKQILSCWLILLLLGCNNRKEPDVNRERGIPNKEIERLLTVLENSDCYYGKGVGISGEPNETYNSYSKLKDIVSDDDWYKLSYKKSPVLRIYSYNALVEKNDTLAILLQKRLMLDTTVFCSKINDLSFKCSISYYVINIKKPN